MSLANDLLAQSRYMVRHEPRRPKQATLRRAVSTAYYALFHFLGDASARLLISGDALRDVRYAAQRAYDHGTMKQACRAFSGSLPASVAPLMTGPVSADLRVVADAFILLQDARHEADYHLARCPVKRRARW